MKKIKSCSAYTLLELLIVIAIISVLCALSISVFSGQVSSAENAVCQANRRNIKAELSYAVLLNAEDPEKVFPAVSNRYSCPDDGKYTLTYDKDTYTISIECSVHGSGYSASPIVNRPVTMGDLKKLNQILLDNMASMANGDIIDSGAPDQMIKSVNKDGTITYTSSKKAMLKSLAKEAGLDIDAMNMTSWALEIKDGHPQCIYWTTADISTLEEGTKVIAYKYNFDEFSSKDYKNVFSVWQMEVKPVDKDKSGSPVDYMILDRGKVQEVGDSKKMNADDKKDFDAIQAVYEDAVSASSSVTHVKYD